MQKAPSGAAFNHLINEGVTYARDSSNLVVLQVKFEFEEDNVTNYKVSRKIKIE